MPSAEIHGRLTGSYKGKPQFGLLGQYWYGTPHWSKVATVSAAGHPAAAIEASQLKWFLDEDSLTGLGSFELENGTHSDMLLVDLAGGSWRVVNLTDLGPEGKGLGKLLFRIFRGHRVRYDVREEERIPFGELKERICTSIQANPDHWRDEEAIAGEAAPPRDEQEMMDELVQSVRNAKSMLELIPIMKDDIRI